MNKYIHKPEGVDEMLSLVGLTAKWVPVKYDRGARLMGTGCWQIFTIVRTSLITERVLGDESFESWVVVIQKICRKREQMKESGF